jgi:actin related protein 2/3 complex, subunit 5
LLGALHSDTMALPLFQDKAAENVISVLNLIKESQVDGMVNDLSAEERDTVMKYLYKGMALGENCGPMLKWHASIVEKNGIGSITKAMTDRKV